MNVRFWISCGVLAALVLGGSSNAQDDPEDTLSMCEQMCADEEERCYESCDDSDLECEDACFESAKACYEECDGI